jgi:hypothetical protein
MQFHDYLADIAAAVRTQDGAALSSLLSLDGPHIPQLLMTMHDSSVSPPPLRCLAKPTVTLETSYDWF